MRCTLERTLRLPVSCGRCPWGECQHGAELEVSYTAVAEVTDQGEGREADVHVLSVVGQESPVTLKDLDEKELREAFWLEYVRLEAEEAERLEEALATLRRRYQFLKKLGDKPRASLLVAQAEKAGNVYG